MIAEDVWYYWHAAQLSWLLSSSFLGRRICSSFYSTIAFSINNYDWQCNFPSGIIYTIFCSGDDHLKALLLKFV
jgi:hypothetical protein